VIFKAFCIPGGLMPAIDRCFEIAREQAYSRKNNSGIKRRFNDARNTALIDPEVLSPIIQYTDTMFDFAFRGKNIGICIHMNDGYL
jgi:hypothetical protein